MRLSKYAEKVLAYYKAGLWNETMVRNAMAKGKITKKEMDYILSQGPDEAVE